MRERIERIIKEKGLQSSSFADKIEVSRGTISHILNGRIQNGIRVYNDPSNDTIKKILKTFPDISSSWFRDGEGPMYNRERAFVQPDLFGEKKPVELFDKPQVSEYSLNNEVKIPENKAESTIIQEFKLPNIPSKKIDKIMIFFSDKTFMTFIAEE
jgi:transcriptional regulator with XRE-family HTH domain